ncbi:MAG: SusC/RagA family TonB-linked outer membrane protein [Paludibacteraceae bacterium]
MKKFFTLMALCMLSIGMMAEQQVSGVVVDEKNEPIIGASIQVKDGTQGTITDYDGEFFLTVPDDATVLVVSYVGMQSQEVPVKRNVRVVMHEATEVIQEVVVTGYGNVSKGSYAGSAQAVDAETIEKKSPTEISKALAGEVAGVQVINTSGQPGTNATIRIRGVGSLNGSSAPLYVVDGVPYDGDISAIDPGDIASTTILKDASAASLYGARGANGVIVITTKKGNSGDEGKIDVDVKYGANMRLLPLYETISSPEQYVELSWLSLYNGFRANGSTASAAQDAANKALYSSSGLSTGYNLWENEGRFLINSTLAEDGKSLASYGFDPSMMTRRKGYENLESWKDAIFRVGQKLDASIKFHGGTEKINYYTSIGYLMDEGYYQASDYNRFTVRSNIDFKPKKWLKGNVNISYTYSDMNSPNQDGDGAMNNGFYYVNAIPAIYPVYLRNENGETYTDPRTGLLAYDYGTTLNRAFGFGINPAGSLRLDKERYVENTLDAKGMLEFKLYDGLKLRINAGMLYLNEKASQLTNKYYGDAEGIGRIYQHSYNLLAITAQELLEYDKEFGDHTVSLMAGHENNICQYGYMYGSKSYLADGSSLELGNAIQMNDISGTTNRFAIDSWVASARYSYKDRYTLNAYYRAEGSSRYAPGHRWGHFGSVGVAWTFTNEDFCEPAREYLKDGKLRLSWGELGNQVSSLYSYTDLYSIENVNGEIGYVWGSKGNENITWERTSHTDLGLEFSIGKWLDVELDYFYKLTDNMLFPRAVAPSLGYSSLPVNDAKMVNQGVEFGFKVHAVDTRNVKLDIQLNGAHYTNKMLEMPIDYYDENGNPVRQKMNGAMSVGHSLYDHYTYVYEGVNENGEALYRAWYDPSKGELGAVLPNNERNYITSLHLWLLENPDKTEKDLAYETTPDYTIATQQYTGQSYLPDLDGGFGIDLEVYGVTLSASCSYRIGGYGYDITYMALMDDGVVGGHNWHVDMLNSWTEFNTETNIPKLTNGMGDYASFTNSASTRFLTSNSYLSLNDVQVGYNFPKKLIEKIKLNRLNIYVSATNLAIATARKGYNPMTSFTGSSDTHGYSPLSTIMGGIKLSF